MDAPIFQPGMIVTIKGDKRRWKVPEPTDYPERCDWGVSDHCIDCTVKHGFNHEPCFEYVLMELNQVGTFTGHIDTHVCEQKLKLAKG